MLKHSLRIFFRSLKKRGSSSLISIVGLSAGLTCVIMIFLWVTDELSVDRFHEHDDRIFQVMHNTPQADGYSTSDGTPGILAQALLEEMPEVEHASNVIPPEWFDNEKGIVTVGTIGVKARGQFVEKDYFDIFSWELIRGNKENVFADNNAVLLSREMAERLFQSVDNAIGKTLEWKQEDSDGQYVINGIFEKPPPNSTAQFDLLFNYEAILGMNASSLKNWGDSGPETFIMLKKGADLDLLSTKIRTFQRMKYGAIEGTDAADELGTLFLRPYSSRYLYGNYENGAQAGGRIVYVKLFSLIAIFILIIAAVNFINLTTARATKRRKEIGMKKIVGARKRALVVQFLLESTITTLISTLAALLIVWLLLPEFNTITGKLITLEFSVGNLSAILSIAIITGLIAGSYPALYLSKFRPLTILKGNQKTSKGEAITRKGLVIFQFAVSIILIVSVMVIYQQIEFVQSKYLGYNKDNVLFIEVEESISDDPEPFLKEVKKIAGVLHASGFDDDLVGDVGGTGALTWEGKNPDERIEFGRLSVDYGWFDLLKMEMVQGRPFSREFGAEEEKIIFNESAIAAIGLKNPIGKNVQMWGKDLQIIGVVKDFHFESLHEKVRPCFIQYRTGLSNVLVRVQEGTEQETLSRIEQFYKSYSGGLPLTYRFIDNDYNALYDSEKKAAKLSQYFAGLAILISCLGLFGLAAFTAENRKKEIGIRKVLGQTASEVTVLLSSEFAKLVLISILISLPIAYLLASNWLSSFAYSIPLQFWYFLGAGFVALLAAIITVGSHSIRAANKNPVDVLRIE